MIFAALAAATIAAVSCAGRFEMEPLVNEGLVLKLDSGEMQTKANDGVPSFETAVNHFDFFFFADAEGTTPIPGMHGYAEGSTKILDTQEGKQFAPLRQRTSYVYILANYPTALNHQKDWTLEEILELPVDSPIVTEKKTEVNPITGESEETGEVVFADGLVMDSYQEANGVASYTTELTPAKIQEERTVTVGLTRLASKITVTMNIAERVDVSDDEYWVPIVKDLRAYYVNALNNISDMQATPVKRSDLTDESDYEYLTYPTLYPVSAEGFVVTTSPAYTYPQEWTSDDNGEPYFKIAMPWLSNKRGSSNIYYKVTIPKPDNGQWTIGRNKWYKVDLDLSIVDTENEYVEVDYSYTISDWADSGWIGGNGLSSARFFDVPVREFNLYSDETLAIPYSSSSAVTAYFTEISYWYYGSTNGTHYHFRFDPDDQVSTVTLPTNKDSDNQSLNVKNYLGTAVDAAKDLNEYSLAPDGKAVNFSHALNDIFSVRTIKVTLVNQDGRSADVVITQHPAIEVVAHNSKNAFLDGWYYLGTEDVRDADGNLTGYTYTPTGNPYMAHIPYWRTRTAWSASGHTLYGTLFANGNTSVRADHFFTTEVSVSAFTESNNKYKVREGGTDGSVVEKAYRLGDPRVPASKYYKSTTATGTTPRFVLKPYLYSDKAKREDLGGGSYREYDEAADVTKAWEEPLKILIASQATEDQNIIAPRLLVSSHMNITSGVDWNNSDGTGVVQRCAMYQENGYPAGRWRLPTEAEFAFMMQLQADGTLPGLFANNCYYRIADGRKIHIGDNNNIIPYTESNSGTVYIRMVYDLWYWGDDPTEGVEKIRTREMMTDWEKATDPATGLPNWKAHWADYYHANMHEH